MSTFNRNFVGVRNKIEGYRQIYKEIEGQKEKDRENVRKKGK